MDETRRGRSAVARLMGLVALVALALAWPASWCVVLPVVAWRAAAGLGLSWGRPLALVLLTLYAPGVVGFFSDCSHCRGVWTWLWPVVPGLLPTEYLRVLTDHRRVGDGLMFAEAGAFTLAMIAAATLAGRRGGWRLAVTLAATLAVGIVANLGVYSLIRS